MARKKYHSGGTTAATRRALRLLRDMGMTGRYDSNSGRVMLECGHLVFADSVFKRGGVYYSYCPKDDDWAVILRRGTSSDFFWERKSQGEEVPLWQPDHTQSQDGMQNGAPDSDTPKLSGDS